MFIALNLENTRPEVVVQVFERVQLDRFRILTVFLAHLIKNQWQFSPTLAASGYHRLVAVVAHQCVIRNDRELVAH